MHPDVFAHYGGSVVRRRRHRSGPHGCSWWLVTTAPTRRLGLKPVGIFELASASPLGLRRALALMIAACSRGQHEVGSACGDRWSRRPSWGRPGCTARSAGIARGPESPVPIFPPWAGFPAPTGRTATAHYPCCRCPGAALCLGLSLVQPPPSAATIERYFPRGGLIGGTARNGSGLRTGCSACSCWCRFSQSARCSGGNTVKGFDPRTRGGARRPSAWRPRGLPPPPPSGAVEIERRNVCRARSHPRSAQGRAALRQPSV